MRPASSPPQRRSKLFVDVDLQGRIVRRMLWHWLIFMVVGTTIAVTLRWFTHPTVPLRQQWPEMFAAFGPFLAAMLALLPVFTVDTIKLTNRFAGPFGRLRVHLRALVAGEHPGPVRFRADDCWREIESDLNALMSELETLRQQVHAHPSGSWELAGSRADVREWPGGDEFEFGARGDT